MVTFKGRADRGTYAFTWAAVIGFAFVAAFAMTLLGDSNSEIASSISLVIYAAAVVGIVVVVVSVTVRRLRDISWPVWLAVLQFVPLINLILILILLFTPGKPPQAEQGGGHPV